MSKNLLYATIRKAEHTDYGEVTFHRIGKRFNSVYELTEKNYKRLIRAGRVQLSDEMFEVEIWPERRWEELK